jgi:hypothetical protein
MWLKLKNENTEFNLIYNIIHVIMDNIMLPEDSSVERNE